MGRVELCSNRYYTNWDCGDSLSSLFFSLSLSLSSLSLSLIHTLALALTSLALFVALRADRSIAQSLVKFIVNCEVKFNVRVRVMFLFGKSYYSTLISLYQRTAEWIYSSGTTEPQQTIRSGQNRMICMQSLCILIENYYAYNAFLLTSQKSHFYYTLYIRISETLYTEFHYSSLLFHEIVFIIL